MDKEHTHTHIMRVVLDKLDAAPDGQTGVLTDFMALSLPDIDEAFVKNLISLVPFLPQNLYHKWILMFIGRLFESLSHDQLDELCNDSKNSNTTLGMAYLIFMESALMEKQLRADLAELDAKGQLGNKASALVACLDVRLTQPMGSA